MNHEKPLKCFSDDCCEDGIYWQRLRATNKSSIFPVIQPHNSITPIINRYFYIVPTNMNLTNGTTLLANLFSDDNGNPITTFKIFNPNGYINLYINAVMQEGGVYTVNENALTIHPFNTTISANTPIIIESLGFISKTI